MFLEDGIVKMSEFFQAVCELNAVPIRSPAAFAEMDRLVLKSTCRCEGPREAGTALTKRNRAEGRSRFLIEVQCPRHWSSGPPAVWGWPRTDTG